MDFETETLITHTLRGEGWDASEDGTGRVTPIIPVAFDCKASAGFMPAPSETAPTLRSMSAAGGRNNGGGQIATTTASGVRRLTPRECERLQGFQDDWTKIAWWEWSEPRQVKSGHGRVSTRQIRRWKEASDGPRYEAVGNSMAAPVMAWIGRRIAMVDALP